MNAELLGTLGRSLFVSGAATLLAVSVGVPLGVIVGARRVPGRAAAITLLHATLGLPTVLVGLVAILLLGREGPLGGLGLLYTPTAMILAQAVIAFPIVAVFTVSAIQAVDPRLVLQIRALGASRMQELRWLARHARLGLLAATMAAFGAAASEVGAALMVGGNLKGYTRVLTTATLLEARMGHYEAAVGFAVLLLFVTLLVNGTLTMIQQRNQHKPQLVTDIEVHPEESDDVAIRATKLTMSYDRTVVSVNELDVRRGETLAILGPNGAGKSTLLRLLGCLERPTSGRVSVNATGETRPLELRRQLAMIPQDPPMLDASARENVEAGLRLRGSKDRRRRADEWLDRVGLGEVADQNARQLSGGEQRRVALARALACDPRVLLLDEPFVSLDPPARASFIDLFQRVVRAGGRTTVLVTQERDEALQLADRVAVMWEGRVEQLGSVREVMTRPATPEVARFLGTETIVAGQVERTHDGVSWVRVSDQLLQAASACDTEEVWLCIRPENVAVRVPGVAGSTTARNALRGHVTQITQTTAYHRVMLDVGFPLAAAVTSLSLEELGLEVGSSIEAVVKATAVHAIPIGPKPAQSIK